MQTTILRKGPQFRCYRCGSTEVKVICHHCGRPMCAEHGPVRPAFRWFTENREFTDLTLGQWPLNRTEPAHCAEHVHSSPNYRIIMIAPGVIALLASLVMLVVYGSQLFDCVLRLPDRLPAGPAALAEFLRAARNYAGLPENICYTYQIWDGLWPVLQGLLLFGAGLAAIFVGSYLNRQNVAAEIAGRQTEAPLGPISQRIDVREEMHINLRIDESRNSSARLIGQIRGEIDPGFRFSHLDIQRIGEYRRKYNLPNSNDLPFQAGFLALEGQPLIDPISDAPLPVQHITITDARYLPERNNFYWLEGQIDRHPFLTGSRGQVNSLWPIQWRYTVPLEVQAPREYSSGVRPNDHDNWGGCPVRIIPVRPTGRSNRLKLQVQFNPADFPGIQPTPSSKESELVKEDQVLLVELAQVWLDAERFGAPRSSGVVSSIVKSIEGNAQPVFQVEWRGLWAAVKLQPTVFELPVIELDQAIEPGARLKGRLRLRVPALRSAIRRVRYFSALGQPVSAQDDAEAPLPFQGTTTIEVDFDLALADLPVSELETLPIQPIEKPGAPAPERMRQLLDALNRRQNQPSPDYYVRRVVESTPQMGEQSLESGRWHWDISGRFYKSTYPADFHLVVYGSGDAEKGYTRLEGTVQGQVFEESLGAGLEYAPSRIYLTEIQTEIEQLIHQAFKPYSKS